MYQKLRIIEFRYNHGKDFDFCLEENIKQFSENGKYNVRIVNVIENSRLYIPDEVTSSTLPENIKMNYIKLALEITE